MPYIALVTEFAARHRLPAIYAVAPAVLQWGGLMSYSPNLPMVVERTAAIVDRILRGARPQDIPVEQPTNFILAVNLKTAKAMGLTLPPTVLMSADRVVE